MGDINNSERGLAGDSRGVARDAGTASAGESKFWRKATQRHRVVFSSTFYNAAFDFLPDSTGTSGSVRGTGMAGKHNGSYEIVRSSPDSFSMQVTLGTKENATEDMDALLVIDKSGASVSGTLKGKPQQRSEPVKVTGSGTVQDPFRADFPAQELVWYLP